MSGWSYQGPTGPQHWGELDPKFVLAKTGRRQSPIDLAGPFHPGAATVFFDYRDVPLQVVNNGHSIQVDCPQGGAITVGGRQFRLVQFHFHTPSEHTVQGRHHDMELHLVHQDDQGRLAVVGIFMAPGEPARTIRTVWDHLPTYAGDSLSPPGVRVSATDLLPGNRHFVQYDGSLTTPPCSEDVLWIMMLEPIGVSPQQVSRFESVIGPSNRPVQPLNERVLLEGT